MPPKKDTPASNGGAVALDSTGFALKGLDAKETRLLAAAFISSIGPNKFNFDVMADLTGSTTKTVRNVMATIKRKALEANPDFGWFTGDKTAAEASKTTPASTPVKAARGRKRKADEEVADAEDKGSDSDAAKKVKTEEDDPGDMEAKTTVKKGAKKKAAPKAAAPKAAAPKAAAPKADAPKADAPNAEGAAPKKRGRPPKNKKATEDAEKAKENSKSKAKSATAPPETETDDTVKAEDEVEDEDEEEDEEEDD